MTKRELTIAVMKAIVIGYNQQIGISSVFDRLGIYGDEQQTFIQYLVDQELFLRLTDGQNLIYSVNHGFKEGDIQLMQILVNEFGQDWSYPIDATDFRQKILGIYSPDVLTITSSDIGSCQYSNYLPFVVGATLDWFLRIHLLTDDFLGEFAKHDPNFFAKLFSCPVIDEIFSDPFLRMRFSRFEDTQILATHNCFVFSFSSLTPDAIEFALEFLQTR